MGDVHVDSTKPSSKRDFRRAGCSLHWEEGEERCLGFCRVMSRISHEVRVADFACRCCQKPDGVGLFGLKEVR